MSRRPRAPRRADGSLRLVLTTFPSTDAASTAVDEVLRQHLAACANWVPVDSRYWWKGKVETARETLVVFKTGPNAAGTLMRYLKASHPYAVPEVAEVDVLRVDSAYGAYLRETVKPSGLAGRKPLRPTRPAGRRVRAAPTPERTRGRRLRRSR